jgi:hypothetical protein
MAAVWKWFGDEDDFVEFSATICAKLEAAYQADGIRARTQLKVGSHKYVICHQTDRWIQHRSGNSSLWREVQREVVPCDDDGSKRDAVLPSPPAPAAQGLMDAETESDSDSGDERKVMRAVPAAAPKGKGKRKACPQEDAATKMIRGDFDLGSGASLSAARAPAPAEGADRSSGSSGSSSHQLPAGVAAEDVEALMRRAPPSFRTADDMHAQIVELLQRTPEECRDALANVERAIQEQQEGGTISGSSEDLAFVQTVLRERAGLSQ